MVAASLMPCLAGSLARGGEAPLSRPATGAASPASQPADGIPEAERLVAGLGSDNAMTRQASQDALIRMGEHGRPLLARAIAQTKDLEVITRAEAALRQIDEDRVVGSSYITLHLKDAEPRVALAEISRQAFAPLAVFPDDLLEQGGLPKVNLDLVRQPFWVAMRQFSGQTGLDLQPFNEGVRLMRSGMRANGPSVIFGPFLVVATQISRTQVIQLGQDGGANGGQSDFRLNLVAYSEPKLKVLRSSGVKLDEAVDDLGNSLLFSGPDNRGYYGGSAGYWQLSVQLAWPEKPGSRIARLRGSENFTVQTKAKTIEIDDLPSAKEKTESLGGMVLTVHSFAHNADTWELKVSMKVNSLNSPGWAQIQQVFQTGMRVVDSQGVALDRRGMNSRGTNDHVGNHLVDMTLQFAASGGRNPVKLVWEIPLETKDINVPFEFKNLPMPRN